MALSYVGSLPFPLLCPSVQLSIGVPAISLNASLTGALALNASLSVSPPTIEVYLSALAELQTQLELGISLGVPSVSFGVTVEAGLAAALALVAQLELGFSLLVVLEGLLTASIGMYAYTYNDIASSFGAAVTSELATEWPDGAPTTANCNAIIFGAASSAAQSAMTRFLNGLIFGTGLVYTGKLSAMAQMSLVTAAATTQGSSAISAQLTAAAAIVASAQANVSVAPPTLAITAVALANFAANLEAQIKFGPPSISAALSATANIAANISAKFNFMAELGLALDFGGLLFAYTYSGPADTMGAALTSSLATHWGDGHTLTNTDAIISLLAATDSLTYGIMTGFFGGV